MSSYLTDINPNAEIISKTQARAVNVAAGVGLCNVLKSNLGPRGTLKLLVGGAGQLKLTKDGLVLLKEMQIQHPTACLIARTATAQDDVTGDGTTSTVLLCGELLRQADMQLSEGLHPRILVDGLEVAREEALKFLQQSCRTTFESSEEMVENRDLLESVARTSLATKVDAKIAKCLASVVTSSIQTIYTNPNEPLDLNRIEILSMPRTSVSTHLFGSDSEMAQFVNGLVLDHGARHPDMPTLLTNCRIMTCNLSLEYEKTETQSGFYYSTAEEREKLVESERKWLDERCRLIIDFKRSVCDPKQQSLVIINQKGVDPLSLDMFAKEGNILCLRRAKRRNMERLTLACGGSPIHSLQDLEESQLGFAGRVSQVSFGDEKYTLVEECNPPDTTTTSEPTTTNKGGKSCTILLQGPNQHSIAQCKDAIKDGLRALKNALEDKAVVPGGGAFEIAAAMHLRNTVIPKRSGRTKLGIQVFANALEIIPKTLAENSGLDVSTSLLAIQEELQQQHEQSNGDDAVVLVGLDVTTGDPMIPSDMGVWDNVRVKRQSLYLSTVLASQLLLVDEVMRAGKQMGKQPSPMDA